MTTEEMTTEEKLEEGICIQCGRDDVLCEKNCTQHICIDCNYIQGGKGHAGLGECFYSDEHLCDFQYNPNEKEWSCKTPLLDS